MKTKNKKTNKDNQGSRTAHPPALDFCRTTSQMPQLRVYVICVRYMCPYVPAHSSACNVACSKALV